MAKLQVQTKKVRFPVAPTLYGLFFEDINRSGDGGLYPEMLRNRSFDDSVIPADLKEKDGWLYNDNGYPFAYYNGEGFQRWIRDNNNGELTPIPAWYAEGAQMRLETEHTLNAKREAALEVAFEPDGRVWNIGYAGVPAQAGEAYHLYLFAQVEQTTPLELSIEAEVQCLCSCRLTLTGAGFVRYDMVLVPSATSGKGRFVIKAFYETDPEINAAVQESYHRYFNLKADKTRMNLDPAQFIPGLDIPMMYRDMYWASEGYLWETVQRGNVDIAQMEKDFSALMTFWKSVYLRKE